MIIKKTKLSSDSNNPMGYKYKTTVYYMKKQSPTPKTSFQKELFGNMEIKTNYEPLDDIIHDNIENEIKKMFLGEVIKKDHLFSSSLTELQKENIIKISELYY